MPAGPTQTASWFRGKKGWFTARYVELSAAMWRHNDGIADKLYREELILVNRVIRDDPSKGGMHNREPLTFKLLWKSLCDYDLWPLYLIGLTNHVPYGTPNIYLTLSLKGMGFSTFQTNLLVIPSQLLHSKFAPKMPAVGSNGLVVMYMLLLTYLSQLINQMAMIAVIPQFWALPFLLWLRFVDTSAVSKWTTWLVMTIFLGSPYGRSIGILAGGNANLNSPSNPGRLGVSKLQHGQEQNGRGRHV